MVIRGSMGPGLQRFAVVAGHPGMGACSNQSCTGQGTQLARSIQRVRETRMHTHTNTHKHTHTHTHTRARAFVSFFPLQVDVSIGLTG